MYWFQKDLVVVYQGPVIVVSIVVVLEEDLDFEKDLQGLLVLGILVLIVLLLSCI